MSQHVHSVCQTGYYHLRNIARIRRYFTLDATKTLVLALVTSRLDYCNSLLYGLPANHLAKMQHLNNVCARHHKNRSLLTYHFCSKRTSLASSPPPNTVKDLVTHLSCDTPPIASLPECSAIRLQTYTLFMVRINHPVDCAMNPNGNVWRQNFYESSGDTMEQFAC